MAPTLNTLGQVRQTGGEPNAVVRVRNLQYTIKGPQDAWGRPGRPQPVLVSAEVSLYQPFKSSSSKDVVASDTVHYGLLSKSILATLGRLDAASAEQKKSSADEEETDFIILAMRQYVDKDPVTATLAGAAQAAYLSSSYASRYFKQRIGMGFSEYVLEQKMRLAAELLAQPQYRIYEISEQMGYMNPVNFARAFRRYYHVSPHDYRFQKLGRSVPGEESDK